MLDGYLDPNQLEAIKRIGLVSLLGGSGMALYKHLNNGSLLADRPASMGAPSGSMVEVPVPGQQAIPGTSEFFKDRRKRKLKGKSKNLGTYRPGEDVAMEKDSGDKDMFRQSDLYNPYYLPAALTAATVPLVGGYSLLNHLLTKKVKDEKAQELASAKSEFGKALVEAHSNRLNSPVNAVKAASLAEDLDALADIRTGAEKKAGDPVFGLFKNVPDAARALGEKLKSAPGPTDLLKGYAGVLGALGLSLGTAGLYTGFQGAKRNDTDNLESQRYLNEFLNRRVVEGSPIYSVPVPVAVNQKKNTLRPTGDVGRTLTQEA